MWLFSIIFWANADSYRPPPTSGTIIAVYDGDTFTLDNGDKIRLRGANTPELKPPEAFGTEARDAVADLLLNQKVYLSYGDVERDGYGRLIASVRTEDTDVATFLLENGLAHAFFIPPEKLDTPKLLQAQERAQEANKGIWSIRRYQSDLHMTSFHANAPGDDVRNINGEYIRITNITSQTLNLSQYSIQNIRGETWNFPDMDLPAGNTVKVHSGRGYHQKNPEKQLEIYLGSMRPIWDNEKDQATIYNAEHKIQDQRKHEPKTKPKNWSFSGLDLQKLQRLMLHWVT